MKLLTLFSALILCTTMHAKSIMLDEVMTKEEQHKTGVSTLSANQKIALEAWLNQTFVLKHPHAESPKGLSLSFNIDGGKKLELSDNSLWEVDPRDVKTAELWITPFPIKIERSSDPNYPYRLINLLSNASVKAKKVPTYNGSHPQAKPIEK